MLLEPAGIKPAISWSQVGCTSDWATEAKLIIVPKLYLEHWIYHERCVYMLYFSIIGHTHTPTHTHDKHWFQRKRLVWFWGCYIPVSYGSCAVMKNDNYFIPSFNPFMISGLFCHNSLDQSISNSRVLLLLLCFMEIPVINANYVDPIRHHIMWHLICVSYPFGGFPTKMGW